MFSVPFSAHKRECAAEFLGTYLLVLFGAGSVVISSALSAVALLFIAGVFGGTVALVIFLLGKYS